MKRLNTKLLQQKFSLLSKNIDLAKNNIEINSLVEEFVSSLLDSEFVSLWYFDEERMVLLRQREGEGSRELSLDVKEGVIYNSFMTKEAKIYNYLASDKDYVASIDNPDAIKIKSKIILPLIEKERLVGIVTAYSSVKKIKKFNSEDMELLKALAPYLIQILYKMYKPQESRHQESEVVKNIEAIESHGDSKESADTTLQVMANFIHDIRTPSNSLYGFLELLESQIDDKRVKEYITNAKESAGFINELTTSMLERVSMQREKSSSEIKEVESARFFANIAEMFVSNIYAKKISYNIYIDPLLPKVIEIDELKLKRILMNLIGNAYKFTPNGKSIEFSVRYKRDTKELDVRICDEGIGIPKEKQDEIFEAFKQAEDTTSLNYGGTGLGLSICAEYVKDLGGELKLKSEIERGTTFYFTIPLNSKSEDVCCPKIQNSSVKVAVLMSAKNSFCVTNMARYMVRMGLKKENIIAVGTVKDIPSDITNLIVFEHKIDEAAEYMMHNSLKILVVEEELFSITKEENGAYDVISQYDYYAQKLYQFVNLKKPPRVLIVDDDKTSVTLLEKILESEYCEVDVARNGKVALEMLIDSHKRENPYTIVYIDNNMPLMSGLEVMRRVREFERDNKLKPIYAVSTSGNLLDIQKVGKDFNLYVGKPFKIEDIIKALNY